jgi:hypothetical protein
MPAGFSSLNKEDWQHSHSAILLGHVSACLWIIAQEFYLPHTNLHCAIHDPFALTAKRAGSNGLNLLQD